MPNWCYTNITFYSTNEASIKAMHDSFRAIFMGEPTEENDFGHGWMGDYANAFFPEIGTEHIDCRGSVEWFGDVNKQDKYHYFAISTETAWDAKLGMWQEIVTRNYPDVKIAYISEENGTRYYYKWDEDNLFYKDKYYLDGYVPNKEYKGTYLDGDIHYWNGTIQDIQKYLDDILPFEYLHSKDLDEMEKDIQEKLDEFPHKFADDEDNFYIVICRFIPCTPKGFRFKIGGAK